VIADTLCSAGHEVTVFDSFRYGEGPALSLLRHGVRVVRGDVTVPAAVAAEVVRHDAVVHLAALVGFPLCDAEPLMAEEVNVNGTQNVVRAMHADQLLVYASTGSVYGRVDGLCTEDRAPAPLTRYGRTKLDGERIVREFGGVSLRFATLFGVSPCMRFDLMVNAFVYRAVHIGWLVLYQGADRRSFLDVGDAAESYRFALERYDDMAGDVFNVGDPSLNLTKREIAEAVAERFPLRIIHEDVAVDPDQRDYEVSFEKIRTAGFKSQVPLGESIEAIGAAARLNSGESTWRFRP
jgi:nucleoside-diphosphate-sugar epimerase